MPRKNSYIDRKKPCKVCGGTAFYNRTHKCISCRMTTSETQNRAELYGLLKKPSHRKTLEEKWSFDSLC